MRGRSHVWTYRAGGGESTAMVAARWRRWIARVAAEIAGQGVPAIAVTHAGVIRVALAGANRLGPELRVGRAFRIGSSHPHRHSRHGRSRHQRHAGLHAVTTAIGKMLVLGGVRSGKSRYAEELARGQARAVTLIATAEARDEEMAARIEAHRHHRDVRWRVIEEPLALAATLRATISPESLVIVDCLTVWLSNLLVRTRRGRGAARNSRHCSIRCPRSTGDCILISNEVGFGIIPANALARRFGDEAGVLHQRIARLCDRVVLMVAGVPLTVKDPQALMPRPGVSP